MDQNFISILGGFRLLLDRSVIAGPGGINDCKNEKSEDFLFVLCWNGEKRECVLQEMREQRKKMKAEAKTFTRKTE